MRGKEETHYSTELWYSDPAEPPTAYSNSSITATPTRFLGTDIGEQGLQFSIRGLYLELGIGG